MVTDEILTAITQSVENLEFENIDDYLDFRDTHPFDTNWVTADEAVNGYIDKADLTFKAQDETLRESVFKSVAKLTQHYELAGYISDDAGLIFANQYFNVNNEFANQLFIHYQNNILPN